MQTKFKKYINRGLLFLTLASVAILSMFISCDKEDENEISGVVLESFGPMPIARGAELMFIGYNLNQVSAVVLPSNIEITSFNEKTSDLLTLTIPQDAVEGLITLKTPQGDITTKTPITYSEPISIDNFSPTSLKAGQEITISGDYLNLVKEIIFTDRIAIGDTAFTSQSRKELKLVVPQEAQTGKIAISNGAEEPIIIYSSAELTVTLPAFATISPNPVKAGSSLTITGTNLDLVKQIVLGGDKTIAEFISHSETTIELSVPEDTQDGKITMFPASMVGVESSEDLMLVLPTVAVSTTTIKNGQEITVTGTDLYLVDKVLFGGDVEGSIASATETEMKVVVPDAAVTGIIRFTTKAQKEVSGPEITIIDPVFSSFSPGESKANNTITIEGTDLDLVVDVKFAGEVSGVIESQTETQLQVTVPVGASSGLIRLIAKNGNLIVSSSEITITANLPEITGFSEPKGTPGEILTIEGSNLLLIKELIFPGDIKATAYGVKTDEMVQVYVPIDVEKGYGNITIITYEGEQGLSPELFIGGTDPITDETIIVMDFEQHGDHNGYWDSGWSGNTEILEENGNIFLRVNGALDGWILNCNHQANGAPAPVINNVEDYVLKFDIRIEEGVTGAENAQLQFVFADQWNYWYGAGLLPATTNGDWITVSVPVSTWGLTGTFDLSSGTNGLYGGVVPAGVSLDNLRFDPK
ncbi:cell shape determination protein CcmA [Maribellus comscasis]|uniref:Cell shape determination protein CcmA n=1 Tax=Maribellus comscasis TaxID=2681766 RepID=A0A6I6JMD1_9BACT|nr:glycan-binding surface protein [Maribellus comscasis]QGY44076.1 cell shape determination protein CcmA [Maribellus comscasis]